MKRKRGEGECSTSKTRDYATIFLYNLFPLKEVSPAEITLNLVKLTNSLVKPELKNEQDYFKWIFIDKLGIYIKISFRSKYFLTGYYRLIIVKYGTVKK